LTEPTHTMALSVLAEGVGLLELVVASGFAASNGEARRLVEGGGVRLNNRVVDDARRRISSGDLGANDRLSLSVGKRRKALIGFE
jgi:tyrosyl-tRNA synthetase